MTPGLLLNDRRWRWALWAGIALLLLALTLNVQWHSATPEAFEAELWSAVPQAAAPAAVEPEVEPPKPVVAPTPPPAARENSRSSPRPTRSPPTAASPVAAASGGTVITGGPQPRSVIADAPATIRRRREPARYMR